ncbi:sensor histidine kinase [Conexibacter woesei]|uniref:histidine kinase n=1 Tax=Conexibacter woesei (strain DSM 14684 / CCUG 47730 / CIP 108061 / JCM 11494 / NBRC 100937 / ID131577) TaxID=469383 RepID=D3F0W7_CONWI|nr:histidine kinase [Conexibacter woesei]ADB50043.1 integral membrane sensor signal transduction histidine kinase [Conexibacter woesei DSM 14684]
MSTAVNDSRVAGARRADAGLAAAAAAAVFADALADGGEGGWGLMLLTSVAMCAPLAWRRTEPVAALVGVMLGALLHTALGTAVPDSALAFLVALFACYSVAAHAPLTGALAGLAVAVAGSAAVVRVADAAAPVSDFLAPALFFPLVWGLGRVVHGRVVQTLQLRRSAQRLEAERDERARAAVAAERARIARELHDIVAHGVSVMVVQSGAARRLLESDPATARRALEHVEATGRDALAEMRRMLGVLRRADDDLALTPQPRLDQLDVLVRRTRDAGLPVDVRVEGDRTELTAGVDLVAYRVVQEALTNVLKHARATRAVVELRYGATALALEISDDGRPGGTPPAAAAGDGHGLVGMRERVTLYGGRVEAAAGAGGGFRVSALLPYDAGGSP